jgi:hypothetical protein
LIYSINIFKEFDRVIPFWFNPNIHPYREYKKRLDNFEIATISEEKIVVDTYNFDFFLKSVDYGVDRCEKCYHLRLNRTAEVASEKKINSFSTTLLSSPHQNHNRIKDIGFEIQEKCQVSFIYIDLRKYHKIAKETAYKAGLYIQPYCGCIWSEEERFHPDKK